MSWGSVLWFRPEDALQHVWSAGMQSNISRLLSAFVVLAIATSTGSAQEPGSSPVRRLQPGKNTVAVFEKFTVTLEHDARIRRVYDFDDEVIKVEPVHGHPNQITVYAQKEGVTTVTVVDEYDQVLTAEILVRGDVRHLESYLKRLYPNDAIEVEQIKGAVRLSGWVSEPEHINEIVTIAEQFYPLVMNHMQTGGVQQVMLKATIMEVDRSKMRSMGMNFGLINNNGYLNATPGPITPITGITNAIGAAPQVQFTGFNNTSASFAFINNNSIFQGFLKALRTEGLLKIHATPMVVTHNGQPAELQNGGEAPVLVPAGLGVTAIEFKPFGVLLNGVPHILGNDRLRLQIDASVVERDFANAVTVDGITVPSFTVRRVNTQVEMNFGQTLVIGGLIQKREDATTAKLPFFGELPWIGAAFSQKEYNEAETELLILVTPEHVAAMDAEQVPAGGPGLFTDVVTDHELFWHGLVEVPKTGDECSVNVNCLECQSSGGFCGRHPRGSRGGACDRCGSGACSGCTPGGIGPVPDPGASGIQQAPPVTSGYPVQPTRGRPGTPVRTISSGGPAAGGSGPGLIRPGQN